MNVNIPGVLMKVPDMFNLTTIEHVYLFFLATTECVVQVYVCVK